MPELLADVVQPDASDAVVTAHHLAGAIVFGIEFGVLDVVDKSIRISLFEAVEKTA